MIRHFGILSICCSLLGGGFALGDTPPERKQIIPEDVELSETLDDFVDKAIDGGLLVPAGSGDEREAHRINAETHKPLHSKIANLPVPPKQTICNASYGLDFSSYKDVRLYKDLEQYKGKENTELVKAYIALGLNAEAIRLLKSLDDPQMAAYMNLAMLMDSRIVPDREFFKHLAKCHEAAGLWYATALLDFNQQDGAGILSSHISDFRKLPYQLRATVASISVPKLDRYGHRSLAQKLLASFTDEEVANSSRLQFGKALFDMRADDPESNLAMQAYLNQPSFQADALSALARYDAALSAPRKQVLLDQMIQFLESAGDTRETAVRLGFVLGELEAASNYALMRELSELPSLKMQPAQDEIARSYAAALKHNLGSDNALDKMAAVESLLGDTELLGSHPERQALFDQASTFTAGAGYDTLTAALTGKAGKADVDVSRSLPSAELAYRSKNYETLFALADAYPASERIILMAALGAIETNDSERLRTFEPSVAKSSDSILALIEQDALSGTWLVSDDIYTAAQALSDEAHQRRVERVLYIKSAAKTGAGESKKATLRTAEETLFRTRKALGSMSEGMR